jgi:hypothetical protein
MIGREAMTAIAPDYFSIPGQSIDIAHYFPVYVFTQQLGDPGGFGTTTHEGQELLREVKGGSRHGRFPGCCVGCRMPIRRRVCETSSTNKSIPRT